jgi:CheY-like chemotaxis protein
VANCSVLIVDDDPMIVATLADILTSAGYPIRTAGDGYAALEEVECECPDVVLLDMRMPGLDGWGFAQKVARERHRIKIVVMTAAMDAERWATEIHADGYLPKPFDINHLLNQVQRLCPLTS